MDPSKLAAIKDWPAPYTVKQTQSFLRFCNFYQKFIKEFVAIAQPLYYATRKNNGFKWSATCEKVFCTLKDKLTSAPVLSLATDHNLYKIEANASDYASEAVLSQKIDNEWHPVVYYLKGFSATERNYKIYNKEMLAIIRALEEWHYLVQGSQYNLEI